MNKLKKNISVLLSASIVCSALACCQKEQPAEKHPNLSLTAEQIHARNSVTETNPFRYINRDSDDPGLQEWDFIEYKGGLGEFPVRPMSSPSNISPEELFALKDYAFTGYVNAVDGTEYLTPTIPITHFFVTVTENIKGSLKTDVPIVLHTLGGVSYDGEWVLVMHPGDIQPQEGRMYLFTATGNFDGSITAGDVIPLETESDYIRYDEYNADKLRKELSQSKTVSEYREAVKNQGISQYRANFQHWYTVYDAVPENAEQAKNNISHTITEAFPDIKVLSDSEISQNEWYREQEELRSKTENYVY